MVIVIFFVDGKVETIFIFSLNKDAQSSNCLGTFFPPIINIPYLDELDDHPHSFLKLVKLN
jgi:hypothetical protein